MTTYLDDVFDVNDPAWVAVYDELPLWSAAFGLLLLKHVPLRPNATLLDVGCGTGFPLLELAQRLGPSCRACGIDPWKPAVARARQKIDLLGIRNVRVVEGDAAAMPFEAAQFDLIVSNLGINNFDDPQAVAAECWRVAKPGATLALTTNLQGHMKELYDCFHDTLVELGKAARLPNLQAHVEHRTTVARATALVERAGFKVRRVCQESFSLRFLDGSALVRHAFVRVGFLDGWRSILSGEDEKPFFRRLEENLNRQARQRGGLDLTIPAAYLEADKAA